MLRRSKKEPVACYLIGSGVELHDAIWFAGRTVRPARAGCLGKLSVPLPRARARNAPCQPQLANQQVPLGIKGGAIFEGKPIQVGMKIKGRNFDQALFGVVEMSDGQTDQLRQCLAEWAEGIKKKYRDDQPSDAGSGPQ